MRTWRIVLTVMLAAFGLAAPTLHAWAAVPSPANSTVDPCLRVCPAGDMNFHVVVRDLASNPVGNSTVTVDLSACPSVVLCPPLGSEPYTIAPGPVIVTTTNALGIAGVPLRAGGTCGGPVNVHADGVLLATLTAVPSPDQNGDAVVNATDQGILAVKLGGLYDPTADINCNTTMGPDDSAALDHHLGHSCGAVVPVQPRSWGRIKIRYR